MAGYRSSRFFWQDYCNDAPLKLCSLAAQGLWMRMLCICADSDPVGYLMVEGVSVSPEDLATLASKPLDQVAPLLEELGKRRVFSKNARGVIYNRRMVRDAKKAATGTNNLTAAQLTAAHDNGAKGGRPKQQQLDLPPPAEETQAKPTDETQRVSATATKPMNDNDDSAVGAYDKDSRVLSPESKHKNFEELDSVLRALRAPKSALRTADPAVRKQVWEARICTHLRTTINDVDEYVRVVDAYANGEPWARQRFEEADREIKAAAAASEARAA